MCLADKKTDMINKLVLTGMAGMLCMSACSGNVKGSSSSNGMEKDSSKAIICYFSATGTTEKAARRIAQLTGAELYEIVPVQRYSDADLDWRDTTSRSYVEMHDPSSRPAVEGRIENPERFDVVFLGYPNWWNTVPSIIKTFIESNALEGKTIVPFMTSGGGDILNSENELKRAYPTLKFDRGLLMNEVSDEDIKKWTEDESVNLQ